MAASSGNAGGKGAQVTTLGRDDHTLSTVFGQKQFFFKKLVNVFELKQMRQF